MIKLIHTKYWIVCIELSNDYVGTTRGYWQTIGKCKQFEYEYVKYDTGGIIRGVPIRQQNFWETNRKYIPLFSPHY